MPAEPGHSQVSGTEELGDHLDELLIAYRSFYSLLFHLQAIKAKYKDETVVLKAGLSLNNDALRSLKRVRLFLDTWIIAHHLKKWCSKSCVESQEVMEVSAVPPHPNMPVLHGISTE